MQVFGSAILGREHLNNLY